MRSRPCETPCAGSGGLAQGLSAKQARARQRGSRAGAARSRRHGGNLRLPEVAELVHMARLRVLEQLHSHFTPSTTCSRVICLGMMFACHGAAVVTAELSNSRPSFARRACSGVASGATSMPS